MNLSSVNKLTQLFPKLDGELSSVGNQFTFDSDVTPLNDSEMSQTTQTIVISEVNAFLLFAKLY